MPTFGSVRLWLEQCGVLSNVVVCWRSGAQRQRLCVRCEGCCSSNIPHIKHIIFAAAPQTSSILQHWTIHHIAVTTVLRSRRWAKDCPKHVELIQRSIKLLLLRLVGHLCYSPTQVQISAHVSGFPDRGLSLTESVANNFFLHHRIAIFCGAESHGNVTLYICNCVFHAWPFISCAHVKIEPFMVYVDWSSTFFCNDCVTWNGKQCTFLL